MAKPAERETVKPTERRRRLPLKRQFVILEIPGGGARRVGGGDAQGAQGSVRRRRGRGVFIVLLQEGTGEAQDGSVRIISVESGA